MGRPPGVRAARGRARTSEAALPMDRRLFPLQMLIRRRVRPLTAALPARTPGPSASGTSSLSLLGGNFEEQCYF